MKLYYILKDKTPIAVNDVLTWAEWFEKSERHVADELVGMVRVSTVFLGLDHNHSPFSNEPLLFETMIFGGRYGQYCERCTTWTQAEAMHARAMRLVKDALHWRTNKTDKRISYIVYPPDYDPQRITDYARIVICKQFAEAKRMARKAGYGKGSEIVRNLKNIHNHGGGTFSKTIAEFVVE